MEALKEMEVLAVQPLEDKDKKESPFSKEKGDFCVVTGGNVKITP